MDAIDQARGFESKLVAYVKGLGKLKWLAILKHGRLEKPTEEEFAKTIQITAIGIAIIGGMGFCIYLLWEYVPQWLTDLLG